MLSLHKLIAEKSLTHNFTENQPDTNREQFGFSSFGKFLESLFHMGLWLFLDLSFTRSFFKFHPLLTLLDLHPLQCLLLASLPFLISGCFLCVAENVSSLVLLLKDEIWSRISIIRRVKSRLIWGRNFWVICLLLITHFLLKKFSVKPVNSKKQRKTPTLTSSGANRVTLLTLTGATSSIVIEGRLETTFTSGTCYKTNRLCEQNSTGISKVNGLKA